MKTYVLGPNAARKLKGLFAGKGKVGSREVAPSNLAFDLEYATPFTVQWAQSVNDGQGAWIIWMPTDSLVIANNGSLDPTEEMEAAGGDYPDGWFVLDDEQLSADEGGELYLNVTYGSGERSAEFAAEPINAGDSDDEDTRHASIKICEAAVDAATGARGVKQYVTSVILIASGGGGEGNIYFADERSVTRCGQESTDPTQIFDTNYFHIYGFGKFTARGYAAPIGTYQAATELEIDPNSGEATNVAFLVRYGNSSSPDSNYIGYRKLKIGNGGVSSPFNYEKSTTVDPSTHQPVTTHKLVNCKFYWEGELQSLPDFDVSGMIDGGSVYLVGKQQAPSASAADPDWTWQLANAEGQAPSGGKVLNYKLWEFANGKPSIDFRTTFLALEDTTPKARIEVKRPDGQGSIVMDSTGEKPKLVISDGTKSCTIDLGQIPDTCAGGQYGFHSIQYKDTSGDTQIYHGIFCDDIDLTDIQAGGKTIEDTEVTATTTGTRIVFYYTDGSQDEFVINNGLRGKQGDKGDDGDTPVISGVRAGNVTNIFADGVLIAQLPDGHTPVITATKSGKTTTIYADGQPIATIEDGSADHDEYERKSVVSDVKFVIEDGKLKAKISKLEMSIPNWDGAVAVEWEDVIDREICDVEELEVVTSESYSTSSHQFKNTRKKIKVLGAQDAEGETPFTATPLSSE